MSEEAYSELTGEIRECAGPGCGQAFRVRSRYPTQKYCSSSCRERAYRARGGHNVYPSPLRTKGAEMPKLSFEEPRRAGLLDSLPGASRPTKSSVGEAPRSESEGETLRILVPTDSFGFSVTSDYYQGSEVLVIEISTKK